MIDEDLGEDQDDIDADIEAATTKATQTTELKKSLLYIIAEITSEEPTTVTSSATTAQKPLIRSPNQTPRAASTGKGAQPFSDAAAMQVL